MTISNKDRSENVSLALRLLGNRFGGERVDGLIDSDDPVFNNVLPTTRKSLTDQGLLSEVPWGYRLTGRGWMEALNATGKLCDGQTKVNLGNLCAKLKKRIKQTARTEEGLVLIDELVTETGLPEYWIYNVIERQLIEECLKAFSKREALIGHQATKINIT